MTKNEIINTMDSQQRADYRALDDQVVQTCVDVGMNSLKVDCIQEMSRVEGIDQLSKTFNGNSVAELMNTEALRLTVLCRQKQVIEQRLKEKHLPWITHDLNEAYVLPKK